MRACKEGVTVASIKAATVERRAGAGGNLSARKEEAMGKGEFGELARVRAGAGAPLGEEIRGAFARDCLGEVVSRGRCAATV